MKPSNIDLRFPFTTIRSQDKIVRSFYLYNYRKSHFH